MLGEAGLDIHDPNATLQEHVDNAKNMIATSLGMHLAGRIIGAARDAFRSDGTQQGQQPGGAQPGTQNGQPNGTPGGAPSGTPGAGAFDADAAVDEVFGAGTANAAKQQQQRANQQYQQSQQGGQSQAGPQVDPAEASRRRAAAEAARKAAEDAWWKQRQADYDARRQQQQSQQYQQSQQSQLSQSSSSGPEARTFATQDEFNAFMEQASKNGDAEQGHEVWKLNQKFFQRWFKDTAKSTDNDLHDFRTSVLNNRNNADHATWAEQQRKDRAASGQQQEQQSQPGNAPADDSGTGAPASSGEPPRESSGGTGGSGPAQQEPSAATAAVAPTPADNPASRAAEQAAASGDHAAASVLAEVAKTVEQAKQTVAQQTPAAAPQVQQPQTPSAAPVQFGGQAPLKDVKPLKTANVEGYTGRGIDASMAEFPVLNHINLNPIHLPPPGTESGKAGESRRWRENIGKYWHQFLFSSNPRALRVDQVAQLAYDNYNAQGQHVPLISAPTADALMEAVQREIGVRGTMRAEIAKEKRRENLKLKQFKNFDKAAQSGDVPATAGHVDLGADEYRGLMVGDELTIKGEKVEVTRVHEDEDGNVIGATLKDGPSYGVQEIGPDYVMLVDEFKPRQSKPGGEFVSEADIEAAKQELQPKPEAATPAADELLSSDTKTAEQIAAEKAAEADKLQRMQDAQDIRVGAAKPLQAADDVLPENDMFDQSRNSNDLFSQPKPAPAPASKTSELILWGRQPGGVWIKLSSNVSEAEVKRRTKEGWETARYPKGQGPETPTNQQASQQAQPQQRNERAAQTDKNPLLTAKEQGLPPVAQAGHKASIAAAISLNEPFNAAEALRYGFQIPKGFTVDDNGIAHFQGVVEGIPNPDPKSIQPADSDTAEQARLKTAIARATEDLQAAMEDNDESGAAAIQRSIQALTQRLAGLSREAPKAPMRELHEFTRDEAKALGKLKEHRAAVKMALESGQTVPDEVLADYTDSKWAADEIKRRVESQQPDEPGKPRDAVEESLERAIDASQKRANARRKNTYSNPFAGIADDVWRDALKTALFIYRT